MYITWQVLVCAPFLVNHWLGYRIPLLLIQGLLVAVLLICLPYSHATNHFPHCLFFYYSYGSISRVVYFALTSTMQPTSRKPANLTSI